MEHTFLLTVRLSERNGDLGKGVLEIFRMNLRSWLPACVTNWDPSISPSQVCSMLGYKSVNSSKIAKRSGNQTLVPISLTNGKDMMWKMYQHKDSNLIKDFGSCNPNENYPVLDLTCSNYGK